MANISPITSHGVHVDGADVPEVTKWSIQPKNAGTAYASSSTAGWKKRIKGVSDLSGSFECKCDDTTRLESIVKPGQLIAALDLYYNGTLKHTGPAFIDDVSIEADIDTGAPVSATVSFSANGAWSSFT